MTTALKLVITSKKNLEAKYGAEFGRVDKLLKALVKTDKRRGLATEIVYIDENASASQAGITAVSSVTMQSTKETVDLLYKKRKPAYLVLFGAQDIVPLQQITNPAKDDDALVPSDLPYACDGAFSDDIRSFTGPTRVVGRIPDVPGQPDLRYLKEVFATILAWKPLDADEYKNYFAVTAEAWKESTQESLQYVFKNDARLKVCPPAGRHYRPADLKARTHFYNCHGAPEGTKFWGQKRSDYPTAMSANYLQHHITKGTVVAAECCYGAEVFNPYLHPSGMLSIATTYLQNKAIAFAGSSTTAYGPSEGQGLADLMARSFVQSILAGASSGRALLEARQKFLSKSGPHLDPYELKTLAQFYLLGDPSLQPALETVSRSEGNTIQNRRLNLSNKGTDLHENVLPSVGVTAPSAKERDPHSAEVKRAMKIAGFTGREPFELYEAKSSSSHSTGVSETPVTFKAFIKKPETTSFGVSTCDVMIVKEQGKQMLGWKVYHRK